MSRRKVLLRPDPALLTPARVAAVMRRLGLEWAVAPDFLPDPLPPVVESFDGEWWVGGDVTVGYIGSEDDFPERGDWACQCQLGTPAHCPHVASAVLAHAWNDERLRPVFDQPAWALDLEPLLAPPFEEAAAQRAPHEGWIRYRLGTGRGLPLTREVVRCSKRDGRELQPQPVLDDLESVRERIDGVTDVDTLIHDLLTARAVAREPGLANRLGARVMATLLGAHDVWFKDRPLQPNPTPLAPVLQATDGGEGVHLSWKVGVRHVIPLGPGFAITHDDELRPVCGDVGAEALMGDLPAVRPEEVEGFLDRFVLRCRVPVELDTRHLPLTRRPDAMEARVVLSEEAEALHIALGFAYTVGETTTTVEADAPQTVLRVGDALVARQTERELRLRGDLRGRLGGRDVPTTLRDDEAFAFLLKALPTGPPWAVYGGDGLVRHRVRGRLSAHVGVPSGIDWLDLDVRFNVDDLSLDGDAVLRSWLDGRRFHRLPDGTVAEIPEVWLERHGRAAAELVDLRRATGRVGAFAAPLVASLLDELAEEEQLRWRAAVDRIANVGQVAHRDTPEGLLGDLRDYQHSGFRWICYLRDGGLGGVLADDMGLGKTIQAIAALLDTHRGHRSDGPPSLVVAPTSVVYNWQLELERFAPSLKVLVHHGPDRGGSDFDAYDVVVTTYALLRIDSPRFIERTWRYAILDEAQQIKNPASQLAQTARALTATHRLALTGTPLENHLLELWSLFEFLMPGFFGSRNAFRKRYVVPIQSERDPTAMAALRRRLKPFVLRRLKSEVARELPPRQEQTLYCELGEGQRRLYSQVKATYRASVMNRVSERGVGGATLTVLEALTRLRQACCDPALLPWPEAQKVDESAKTELLLSTLRDIIEAGHRTLVFSQWPSLLRRIAPHLDEAGWAYLYLDGRTTERQALVDAWNRSDGPPVFLISLKAGGAGLNLTGADHVIHVDPWWNPAVEDQATDRAHRIGQTKPVMAYRLVARDTVEEKVLELQARKRALFEATLDADRTVVDQLTRADLEAVFAGEEDTAPLAR